MKKSFFTRCLAFFLILALVVGQRPLGMSAAMPAMNMNMDQMSADDMAGMDMSASSSDQMMKDCCAGHEGKDHSAKDMTCGGCCAFCTVAQTALLPVQFSAPVQYAFGQTYELTNAAKVIGEPLPPDIPPPKA